MNNKFMLGTLAGAPLIAGTLTPSAVRVSPRRVPPKINIPL
ncbi:hypothetical protein [Microbulbifer sp. TB1203]|nr:hypothetical protein [Microbulbifer sp. TB1203]